MLTEEIPAGTLEPATIAEGLFIGGSPNQICGVLLNPGRQERLTRMNGNCTTATENTRKQVNTKEDHNLQNPKQRISR